MSTPRDGAGHTHLSPHLELDYLDFVCYDWRLVALVKRGVEHLYRIGVKLVGKAGPFECEGHWLLVREEKASFIRGSRLQVFCSEKY